MFNPTETKKNGPARMPAVTPARRRFVFAGWVVLPDTAQSYCDTDTSSVNAARIGVPRSRDSEITSAHWAQNDSPYLCPLNTESGECRLAIRMMSTGLLTLAPVY